MNKILELKNISKKFKNSGNHFHALKNISFSLKMGEVMGVVGPSGSGKTTIGRICVGLLSSSSGSISFKGEKLSYPFPKETRPYLQMVFQEPGMSLSPRLQVIDLIQEPLRINKVPKKKTERLARKIIHEVGLREEHLCRYYWELSGGEIQRAALARALVLQPKLLVLDEISSGLDPITTNEISDLVMKLSKEQSISIIFITHDLGLAWKYCKRIFFLHEGKPSGIINKKEKLLNPEAQILFQTALNRQKI